MKATNIVRAVIIICAGLVGWLFAEDNATNPFERIPNESIGGLLHGDCSTNDIFKADQAITNQTVARKFFKVWQQAKIGRAKYLPATVGNDQYVFISTNQSPLVAIWYPYFTQPRGAAPYSVKQGENEIIIDKHLLPPGLWLLNESGPELEKEMRAAWMPVESLTNSRPQAIR